MNTFNLISNILTEQKMPPDWTKDPTINMVVDFLIKNPNPPDNAIHTLAEEKGINVHKLEAVFYFLATKTAQLLRQGRMNEKGITEKDVDPEQLKMGIQVELEHSNCKKLARKIAVDHLAEVSDYYTRLAKMEKEAGVED